MEAEHVRLPGATLRVRIDMKRHQKGEDAGRVTVVEKSKMMNRFE